jgi:hypothetical protein
MAQGERIKGGKPGPGRRPGLQLQFRHYAAGCREQARHTSALEMDNQPDTGTRLFHVIGVGV